MIQSSNSVLIRDSLHPLIKRVWLASPTDNGSFPGITSENWSFFFIFSDTTLVSATIYGPTDKFREVQFKKGMTYLGIVIPENVTLKDVDKSKIVNDEYKLPIVSNQILLTDTILANAPVYDNAELFIDMLVDAEVVQRVDNLVDIIEQDSPHVISRTAQRHVKHITGLTKSRIVGIRRAQKARVLIEGNMNLADVVVECGYYDQSHLTREIKRITGLTPMQLKSSGRIY